MYLICDIVRYSKPSDYKAQFLTDQHCKRVKVSASHYLGSPSHHFSCASQCTQNRQEHEDISSVELFNVFSYGVVITLQQYRARWSDFKSCITSLSFPRCSTSMHRSSPSSNLSHSNPGLLPYWNFRSICEKHVLTPNLVRTKYSLGQNLIRYGPTEAEGSEEF